MALYRIRKQLTKLCATLGLAVSVSSGIAVQAQESSTNGYVHTPKGRLHILVVFVDEKGNTASNQHWPAGQLPTWAQNSPNDFLSKRPEDIQQTSNMSKFFHDMSGGKFIVTGEVFPELVKIDDFNAFASQTVNEIDQNPAYDNFNWSKFDLRTNKTHSTAWSTDNSNTPGDKVIDYTIYILKKRLSGQGGHVKGSISSYSRYPLNGPSNNYHIKEYYVQEESDGSVSNIVGLFTHEFVHNLYRAPHINGANEVTGPFFYTNNGFGMMKSNIAQFKSANAFERYQLDWLDSYIEISDASQGGVHALADTLVLGQAIRIRLPNSDQSLWLENRQRATEWDDVFGIEFDRYDQPREKFNRGVVAYIEDVAVDRDDDMNYSKGVNGIHYLSPEGNYDLQASATAIESPRWWQTLAHDHRNYTLIKENPIRGQNKNQFIRWDFNNDGRIHYSSDTNGGKSNEQDMVYMWDGEEVDNLGGQLAFGTNRKIDMATNPPPFNMPKYDASNNRLKPTYLNGISINIGGLTPLREAIVSIDLEDYRVHRNVRWTGNLILRNDPDFSPNPFKIDIQPNVRLHLDQSGTPDVSRKIINIDGTEGFSMPTVLTLESGTELIVNNGARMFISNNSTLFAKAGAKITVKGSGRIIFEKGTYFAVEDGAHINLVNPNSSIELAENVGMAKPELSNGSWNFQAKLNICEVRDRMIGAGKILPKEGYLCITGNENIAQLEAQKDGSCIFAPASSSGTDVYPGECDQEGTEMVWLFDEVDGGSPGEVYIRNQKYGTCLYTLPTQNKRVQHRTCSNSDDFIFKREPLFGNYRYRNKKTKFCLYSRVTYNKVATWGCWSDPYMEYKERPYNPQ